MTIRWGYRPHMLRVDLNEETVIREPLPDESILRRYVGDVGLGLYYLLKEVPALVKATDSDMPLIFVLGPLTGTPAVNSGDWTVGSHHLMTPYSAAVGHSHGFWGPGSSTRATKASSSPADQTGPPTCGSMTTPSNCATPLTCGGRTHEKPSSSSS
jgi:hypothetical protein